MLLATGALAGRDTPATPGRGLNGVHLAMEHLVPANRIVAGLADTTPIDAAGRHVVIIGGGDTGADCLGVAHRQGAANVIQLDQYPLPPEIRIAERHPWPTWPVILRNYPAHEEGGDRVFAVAVQEFVNDGQGNVAGGPRRGRRGRAHRRRRTVTITPGSERDLRADLVLLAIGFDGTEQQPLLEQFGIDRNRRGASTPTRLADQRRGCLRRRRHPPRRLADRLGDRRGPLRGRRHPRLPGRRRRPPAPVHAAAQPDRGLTDA